MPITLSCPCGKTLRVADEHAGKRVKCPVCTAVITAPEPAPDFEVVEDEPKPLVAQQPVPKPKPKDKDEDEEGGGYGVKPAEKTAPRPEPQPEFRRRAEDDDEEERPRRKKKKKRASKAEARRAGAEAGQRIAYTVGGGFGAVLGLGLTLWGNSDDGRSATKMMIFGAIIGLCGLVSLIQGLTGNIPEEEEG